jgi:hypothetical protein
VYGYATLDGKDLPIYFNVQDDWDTIEENMDLDYIHTEGWEPFQPNMEHLRDDDPLNATYSIVIGSDNIQRLCNAL